METIPRDILIQIALDLNYIDILRWCVSNKYVNEKVCKNQDFWKKMLYRDYPFIPRFESNNFKKLYKLLRETIVSPNIINKPVYISNNMKQFLQNTDFGTFGGVPISEILNLTLDKNISSRPALATLITYYLRRNKSKTGESFFRIDEHMNKYLGKDLDFNKNKFQSNKIKNNIIKPNISKDGNKEMLEQHRELVNKITEIINNFVIQSNY